MNRANTSPPRVGGLRSPFLWGTILGATSAVGYTAANIFLRSAVACDPVLVTAVKAFPASLLLGLWLLASAARGLPTLPERSVIASLVLVGLAGQLGGNVLFQWALGVVGIALTVPLCLGSIILSSAALARVYLQEPVHLRTILSMLVLVVAIWALAAGAEDASRFLSNDASQSRWITLLALVGACVAGLAYGVMGVVIRYLVMGRASVAATTWLTSIVGFSCLGLTSLGRLGATGLASVSWSDWQNMVAAGICNLIAFVALARALQLTTLIYVNALNASQVAMAAVAGVVIFGEPLSSSLGAGVTLTMLGLFLMPRASTRSQDLDQRPSEEVYECGVKNPRNWSSNSSKAASTHVEKGAAMAAETGATTAPSSTGSSSACRGR